MNKEVNKSVEKRSPYRNVYLHTNWSEFISLCEQLGFGEIENLKIQNGLPIVAEVVKKKIIFSRKEGRIS